MNSKKIVPFVVGVDGLIGSALWQEFRTVCPEASGTSRNGTDRLPYLDIANPDIECLNLRGFTHAIIAGANPNIRQCELDPNRTNACNLIGTLELARQFAAKGIQPILFSTDYVFDGVRGGYREDDPLSPLNQYGLQKAELEKKIPEAASGSYLMIRLGKVVPQKGGILGEMADKLRQNLQVFAAADQIFSPISLEDVVKGVSALMHSRANGIFNLGGPEVWSRYDLALAIARRLRADPALVERISLDDLNEPFKRPKTTDLVSLKFQQVTGLQKRRKLSLIIEELF